MKPTTTHSQDLRQSFVGVVVKAAMKDTATVRVDRYVKNAKYKKYFVRSKKYLAHDPGNTAQVGDTVTIVATRPISKLKHFMIDPKQTVKADAAPTEDVGVPTVSVGK